MKNEIPAVFTITRHDKKYNITSKKYNLYNKYAVDDNKLFDTLSELTDTFNNTLDIPILFEIEN